MFKFIVSLILILMMFVSCGTDKITREDGMAYVSGYVFAEYPGGLDVELNSSLYSLNSKRPARVSFFHEYNEILYSAETDAISEFKLNIEPGLYNIMVETPHSFARFYSDVNIVSDTFLSLDVRYDFVVIDSLVIAFYYYNNLYEPAVTFTEEYERIQLNALNSNIGNILEPGKSLRLTDDDFITDQVFTIYKIPLVKGAFTYDAYSRAQMVLRSGLYNFPLQMMIGNQTYLPYVSFYNGGIDIVLDPDDFYIPDGPYIFDYNDSNYYDPPDTIGGY